MYLADTTLVTLVTPKLNPDPSLARVKPIGMPWAHILDHPKVLPAGRAGGAGAGTEAGGAGTMMPLTNWTS
eukprot:15218461-Ditylum_brightwellii.AAC.1